MWLEIYRSKTHATYPDESMWYCYAFERIPAVEENLDGHLIGWTDDSGPEPFAVIEIPDDTQIVHDEEGWYLQVSECSVPLEAEVVYELAVEQTFGMSVIQERRAEIPGAIWHVASNGQSSDPIVSLLGYDEIGFDTLGL